jgi:hypothetical protein
MAGPSKINIWLKHFLNENCSTTFLNRKESARRSGYKTINEYSLDSIGHQNFAKCRPRIKKWLDENGLSDEALEIKLIALMEARESKFIKVKGAVIRESLPDGVKIVAATGTKVIGKKKEDEHQEDIEVFDETIVSIDVEAIETQRKTLDMALKAKGKYAPIKHQIGSDPDNPPVWDLEITHVETTSKT